MSLGRFWTQALHLGCLGLPSEPNHCPSLLFLMFHNILSYFLAMSISGTEGLQLYEGCRSWLMDEFSRLRESTGFWSVSWRLKCDKFTVLMLLLVRLVTNMQRFLKVEILQKPWRKFFQGSVNARVDESLVKREAAATSLLHSIGWVHSHCTFNTLCVDQVALMSSRWDTLC